MKDHVDKSMGIETHITEALARIKPTESLRLVKRETRKKRNYGNRQEDDGIRPIRVYLTIIPNLQSD
jgi:hypothetical protein